MAHRRMNGFALLAAGLLVAGVSGSVMAQSAPPAAGLASTSWLLGDIGGTPVASGTNATLVFADEYAGGSDSCNRFTTGYTSDGVSTLSFSEIATTMMACDEATMAFAQSYLAALATVASYTQTADALTLMDASGASVLGFGQGAIADVEGPWLVTGYNNGKEAFVSPIADSGLTVAFGPEGTVEGFGGCNNFSGGYSVDGSAIAIGPLMSTMMSCGEELDTQEFQYLTALQAATTWAFEGGSLTLRDDAGAMQVTMVSAIGN